ncbi:MAG: T9SS type A sorting domain-containing protein [Fidelibacterota bacterium]|nr:MAG: T9SS type A sorting domain-containing protein [Candidatus Neomarinimicrobiota bacterium]
MKSSTTIINFTFAFFISSMLLAQGHTTPALKIYPGKVTLEVGDSRQFEAVYTDTAEVESDTTVSWSVSPDSLGTIDTTGLFVAGSPGECIVTGTLDTLMDWTLVTIEKADGEDTTGYEYQHLVILPRDTTVVLGGQVQFQAYYPSDSVSLPGAPVDSALTWSLAGMPVGDLSGEGLLTTTAQGYGVIRAQIGEWEGSSFVVVTDPASDTTGLDTITITRDSPSPHGYTTMGVLTEGELWTLGGLPHPLNVLNGGKVYFPVGSLTEDIRIHIRLPGFTRLDGDSVGFTHKGVIGGIEFQVLVNDTLAEPYNFETPLIVGLVYKRGLLKNMGIDPSTLGLYFATVEDDTVIFDTTGIGYTTVDLSLNRIFSSVAHFSSLAIAGEVGSAEPLDTDPVSIMLPAGYALHPNIPNPFNPTTSIRFALPRATDVSLVVYDLLGNEVVRLVEGYNGAGLQRVVWNGRDASGRRVPSGVYIARLVTVDYSNSIKMLLLK